MAAYRLGSLVTVTDGSAEANHFPFEMDQAAGRLRGHVSKLNPVWETLRAGGEVLIIFQGPNHYISPNWMPGLARNGRVAPSWNYAVVHACGTVSLTEDEAWLRAHLDGLAAQNETGHAVPWTLAAAPEDYKAALTSHIVGLDIAITRLVGKWQTSQQYSEATRANVVAGLQAQGTARAGEVAETILAANPPSEA